MGTMKNILNQHQEELSKIDIQRKAWLVLSALVFVAAGAVIFDATRLEELHILWIITSLGIILSVVWWYWTMNIINKVLTHRNEEIKVLIDLCNEVKSIKEGIRKNGIDRLD
jgi:hypothetical protein